MAFGVTPTGFSIARYEDIRTELVNSLTSKFGPIRSDSQGKFGMVLDVLSSKFADVWAAMEDVYLSKSITAEGTALDDVLYASGLTRLAATKSGLYVVMYGTVGTAIIPGTIVKGAITQNQFTLNSLTNISIALTSVGHIIFQITYVTSYVYTITLDVTVTRSSTGENATLIAENLATQINSTSLLFEATSLGSGRLDIRLIDFSQVGNAITYSSSNMAIEKFGTSMPFQAVEFGPLASPIGDLTEIVTAIFGLSSCENFEDASLGRLIETDTEYRTRFITTRSGLGYSTLNSIANRIKQEVTDVVDCFVFENVTNVTDADGIPPNYIMAVVDCPSTIEQLVAEKLWEVKAGGIGTYGTVSKSVADSQGGVHTVSFSKVITRYFHMTVVITPSTEIAFPTNGFALMQQAIVDYGDSLTIGNDLIFQAFYAPVYSILGIASAVIQIAITTTSGGSPSYGSASIPISKVQKVDFATSRIHISFA